MKIKSVKELSERIAKALDALEEDELYTQSYAALAEAATATAEMKDVVGEVWLQEAEIDLASELHDADGRQPMHPEVAGLITDIYEDCIARGSNIAMCDLASLLYTGRAGEQSYEKAAYYYDMADKAGNRQATENLGYIYYYGRTGEKDYEKAFKYFIKGALDGHLNSLYKVGDFYRNGYYVEKDLREAFLIYQRCVETMTDEAAPLVAAQIYMRMGDCLFRGEGTGRDLMGALHFMSMAECLFYEKLIEGDFYQQESLNYVKKTLAEIKAQIAAELLPDLSWAGYKG